MKKLIVGAIWFVLLLFVLGSALYAGWRYVDNYGWPGHIPRSSLEFRIVVGKTIENGVPVERAVKALEKLDLDCAPVDRTVFKRRGIRCSHEHRSEYGVDAWNVDLMVVGGRIKKYQAGYLEIRF